ncbi:MAG: RimK family alpha-L-glutamate ligase [Cytophagales bacterium]|nr:RimK family alpha-L-glutamate ligase [Bernardetiaceae bacterium]MDW8204658.1 RimK family alpha-L-glutamate ligase [Cytophagales bacterium]
MKLLVLSHTSQSKLVETAQKRGHDVQVLNPDDLYLMISDSVNGYDRIYLKGERVSLSKTDALICRIGKNLSYGLNVVEHINRNMGIYTPSPADGLRIAADKFLCSQRLSQQNIRIPKTVMAYKPDDVDFLIDKVGGLPAVAKTLQGSQGVGVMILESKRAANTSLESMYKNDIDLLLQQYLEGGSRDIRAIVVGDKVSVAMERTANKGDFRANISRGGSGKKIDLTPEETEMAVRAAAASGLEFAGVDIVRDGDKSYVIEVNGNPGSKIIEITGVNFFEDLVKYVEEKAGKKGKKDDEDKGANSILSTIGAFFQPKASEPTRQELLIQKVRKNGLESLTFSEQKFLQDSGADLSFLWDDPNLWWNKRVDSNPFIKS